MARVTALICAILALAAVPARAESKVAKKFEAGPAIQGNSDPAIPGHGKKGAKRAMHRKAM